MRPLKMWVGSFNMAFKDHQTAWETYMKTEPEYSECTKDESYLLLKNYIPKGYDIYVMGV